MYTPEGYGTVFPYMIVDGADALVEFLIRVFGAEVLGQTILPDGRMANTRIGIGTSNFMIGQVAEGGMPSMPGSYYIYVEDVDIIYKAAIAAGASNIFPPDDMPYQDRQAGITDPSGNLWWISKRLVDEPYDS